MLVSETLSSLAERDPGLLVIPFMHQQEVRSTRNIRMHRDREDAYLVRIVSHFPVEIVEMVSPEVLDITRIHPTMAIRGTLDEEHWR